MLLRTFFWRKFIKFLDGRKEKIASEFRAIEEQKAQIDTMRRQYMQKLQSAEDTVKIKIREAIDEGYKIRDELKKKAESESQRIIENAKNEAKNEFLKAKKALSGEITDLVIYATQRLLKEEIAEEKDRQIVNEFIQEIDKAK
jgi:F-type H+-transporting ATPase subunit b